MFDNLIKILEQFLGHIEGYDYQYQADCPACAEDEGGPDGKHNLEINISKGVYRCWKCQYTNEMAGKLSNLIKRYGNENILKEYKDEIIRIKKSKEYELNFEENNIILEVDQVINLPFKTFSFLFDGNEQEKEALEYLKKRGITDYIIKKYNLMYTNNYCLNKKFKNRIIIPSYDKYNQLNYYTGRDYTEKSLRKYFNLENVEKTQIIFNEKFINWDGDIVLVEGPTDHLVVPNSIPLLGKAINPNFRVFESMIKLSKGKIIIFLDDDAMADALILCNKLSCYELCGRLKIVPTKKLLQILNKQKKLDLEKLDPSKLYEIYNHRGIAWAIKMAEDYQCV